MICGMRMAIVVSLLCSSFALMQILDTGHDLEDLAWSFVDEFIKCSLPAFRRCLEIRLNFLPRFQQYQYAGTVKFPYFRIITAWEIATYKIWQVVMTR